MNDVLRSFAWRAHWHALEAECNVPDILNVVKAPFQLSQTKIQTDMSAVDFGLESFNCVKDVVEARRVPDDHLPHTRIIPAQGDSEFSIRHQS